MYSALLAIPSVVVVGICELVVVEGMKLCSAETFVRWFAPLWVVVAYCWSVDRVIGDFTESEGSKVRGASVVIERRRLIELLFPRFCARLGRMAK
jgi:hypothetical protein